mmetsp:Transcript_9880/g.19706  ORF Transcript_9880/g.19706 Transcript_9880/m.19706 type:complete len:203 (-) Transcript_9880:617-1225(-)
MISIFSVFACSKKVISASAQSLHSSLEILPSPSASTAPKSSCETVDENGLLASLVVGAFVSKCTLLLRRFLSSFAFCSLSSCSFLTLCSSSFRFISSSSTRSASISSLRAGMSMGDRFLRNSSTSASPWNPVLDISSRSSFFSRMTLAALLSISLFFCSSSLSLIILTLSRYFCSSSSIFFPARSSFSEISFLASAIVSRLC